MDCSKTKETIHSNMFDMPKDNSISKSWLNIPKSISNTVATIVPKLKDDFKKYQTNTMLKDGYKAFSEYASKLLESEVEAQKVSSELNARL